MSKTQEQLDEELMMSLLPTIDDMFSKLFPSKMFCEAEDAELIEDFEDVVGEEESDDEALETHLRLRNFAEDWDAPAMEAYDDEEESDDE